jgi:tRNA(fMet)-specific endonuclease VapC
MLYILDTDHISLLQRGHQAVLQRLAQVDINDRAVTVVSMVEQVQGRLAVVRRARSEADVSRAFDNLHRTILFFQSVPVLAYSEKAQRLFAEFRGQRVRIGTQDLRIASIATSHGATVVPRNSVDFGQVPGLFIEDWST